MNNDSFIPKNTTEAFFFPLFSFFFCFFCCCWNWQFADANILMLPPPSNWHSQYAPRKYPCPVEKTWIKKWTVSDFFFLSFSFFFHVNFFKKWKMMEIGKSRLSVRTRKIPENLGGLAAMHLISHWTLEMRKHMWGMQITWSGTKEKQANTGGISGLRRNTHIQGVKITQAWELHCLEDSPPPNHGTARMNSYHSTRNISSSTWIWMSFQPQNDDTQPGTIS